MSHTDKHNINAHLGEAVNDKGFWIDQPLSLFDIRTSANPPVSLTGATDPAYVYSSNSLVLRWATTSTAKVVIPFYLPRNAALFNRSNTATKPTVALKVRLLLRSAVAAVAFGGSGTNLYARNQYTSPSGVAITGSLKGAFAAVAASTLANNPTNPSWITLDFTGKLDSNSDRLEPGDQLTLDFGPDAHANSGNVDLHAISFAYRANAPFTRLDER